MPSKSNNTTSKANKGISKVMQSATLCSGPIPPAGELEKYDKVLPGSAERILGMAERQAAHRQKSESKRLDSDIKLETTGQILGFIVFILVIAIGVGLILSDKDIYGFCAILAPLVSMVGLFIYGQHSSNKKD